MSRIYTPVHALELPAFHEVEDGEVTCLPATEQDLFEASHLLSMAHDWLDTGMYHFNKELIQYCGVLNEKDDAKAVYEKHLVEPYEDLEHCLTDGVFVYYQVEADIPPPRKRIGGPETKRYPVWVRGTYEGGGHYSRWEPPEEPEPVNPDDDCECFRRLTDAVHHSIIERVDQILIEAVYCLPCK